MAKPIVYLILACKGAGQFQVLADLIEFGTEKDERTAVYHSSGDESDLEKMLPVRGREVTSVPYRWKEGALSITADIDANLYFVVADGIGNPQDFVESFHKWLGECECELGSVITVLNTGLVVSNRDAWTWYDCCIHFSDIVLLAKREKVTNKRVKAFLDHYEEERYPCLFEYVKKGRVANPALVLGSPPRRITRIFDKPEIFDDDETEDIEEENVSGDPSKDRFLKRGLDGERAIRLPNISEII